MANDWISTGADAFSAVGTVGAFLVGFLLLRREHHRAAGRAEDQRRDQASRISAWIEAHHRADGVRQVVFCIHNASQMPIYEVELPLAVPSPSPGPGDDRDEGEFVGLVPPGQTVRRPAPPEWQRTYVEPEPIQIEFLDSAGHRWTRDEHGALERTARSQD